MSQQPIRFDDGEAYERAMGIWSRVAGRVFLDWLALPPGLRWIDIGCGNGAFTELLVQRCAPSETQGIDPSEAQLTFARMRPAARGAAFLQGDATALPFEGGRFDAAVMALEDFWGSSTITGSMRPTLAAMAARDVEQLKARVRVRLSADASGRIMCHAGANAIQGRVPNLS